MERVTLKHIATKAGVSVSAVSLALSGKGNISEQQQNRIRKLADDMGYVPNPLLASLASKRFRSGNQALGTLVAALEFPVSESGGGGNQYGSEIARCAKELGYQLKRMNLAEIHSYNDVSQTLYRCGMQGIIVTGQPPKEFFADQDRWKHFAIVQCGRFRSSLPFHTVRSDIFRSVKTIFNALAAARYQRIGFAMGSHHDIMEDDEARLGAALGMLHFHARETQRIPPFAGYLDDFSGLVDWVNRERPDVVVGFGVGHYYALQQAGFGIPEDIGFASMHLPSRQAKEPAPIAGLTQQTEIIAQQSVVLLDQLIRYNTRGFPEMPRHTLIPSRWVEGGSIRPQTD